MRLGCAATHMAAAVLAKLYLHHPILHLSSSESYHGSNDRSKQGSNIEPNFNVFAWGHSCLPMGGGFCIMLPVLAERAAWLIIGLS